ncbi:MAG: hypothetical protein ABH877_01235 [bacterium]
MRFTSRRAMLFSVLFGLGLVANLVPVWSIDFLPLGDYWGHIELMDIAARRDDPRTLYAEVFEPPNLLLSNTVGLQLSMLLHPVFSIATVGKLMVSFYVVGVPLALVALALVFERSPSLAFIGLPMVFNAILSVGFLNYLFGLPLLFGALALGRSFAERGGVGRGISLSLLLVACYFAHMIVFLIALALVGWLIVLFLDRRADLRRLAVFLPCLPPLTGWVVRMFDTGTRSFLSRDSGLGLVFKDFDDRVAQMHAWGLQFFRSPVDEYVFGLLAFCWLAILILGFRSSPASGRSRAAGKRWHRRHALELTTVGCIFAYFVLPSHMREMNVITERVIILFLFLLTLWPRMRFAAIRQFALLVPLIGISWCYPWFVKAEFQRFESELVGELPEMIGSLTDRSRLGYLRYPRYNSITYNGPLWYLPRGLHATLNGGISSASFAERHYTPIQYRNRPPVQRIGHRLGDDRQKRILQAYDYLLIRIDGKPENALHHPLLSLMRHDRSWWLFRVQRAP